MIVFLTGASGVGKTTLVERLAEYPAKDLFERYHFDRIGVPGPTDPESRSNWQETATYKWIAELTGKRTKKTIVLEGSADISFIVKGFEQCRFDDYLILLLHCREDVMVERLKHRGQPELANDDMRNWLEYLRAQADEFGVEIIDTTNAGVDGSIKALLAKIEKAKRARP